MDNRRLTRAAVEARLAEVGIQADYMLTDSDPPFIVWHFDGAKITASDDGTRRVRTDTVVIILYGNEYSEANIDAVADAFADFDIDIDNAYISTEELYETTFTISHTGKY